MKTGQSTCLKNLKPTCHNLFKESPCKAPAFSWTAHTAQGQTLQAAIVDMQIGAGTSPMSGNPPVL